MSPLAFVLFLVWVVEGPASAMLSYLNLRSAREDLDAVAHPSATIVEFAIARRHVQAEVLGLITAVAFMLLGVYGVLAVLDVIPPTGGVITLVLLDLGQGLIILSSLGRRTLRDELRRIHEP